MFHRFPINRSVLLSALPWEAFRAKQLLNTFFSSNPSASKFMSIFSKLWTHFWSWFEIWWWGSWNPAPFFHNEWYWQLLHPLSDLLRSSGSFYSLHIDFRLFLSFLQIYPEPPLLLNLGQLRFHILFFRFPASSLICPSPIQQAGTYNYQI